MWLDLIALDEVARIAASRFLDLRGLFLSSNDGASGKVAP
jgi:hypothetical protein